MALVLQTGGSEVTDDLLEQMRGALEQARSELSSSQMQWSQERASLQQQLDTMRSSLARTQEGLEAAVAQVRVLSSSWRGCDEAGIGRRQCRVSVDGLLSAAVPRLQCPLPSLALLRPPYQHVACLNEQQSADKRAPPLCLQQDMTYVEQQVQQLRTLVATPRAADADPFADLFSAATGPSVPVSPLSAGAAGTPRSLPDGELAAVQDRAARAERRVADMTKQLAEARAAADAARKELEQLKQQGQVRLGLCRKPRAPLASCVRL
jgi:hypothetical protein